MLKGGASGATAGILAIVVFALIMSGDRVVQRADAAGGTPYLHSVGMVKRPDAKPRRRLELQLFTRHAHGQSQTLTAQKGNVAAQSAYTGPNENRRFGEWRVTLRTSEGRKVIKKLARRLKRGRRVDFLSTLRTEGSLDWSAYRCVLPDFDELGFCENVPVALPTN